MNVYFTTFNKTRNGEPDDGYINDVLIRYFVSNGVCNRVYDVNSSDLVIYIRIYERNFVFDANTAKQIKDKNLKLVIIDYTEYGFQAYSTPEFFNRFDILGYEVHEFYSMVNHNAYKEEWFKLHNFFMDVSDNITCYFRRDLSSKLDLSKCTKFPIYPIDYFNYVNTKYHNQSLEEFSNRPIDIFFSGHLANQDRSRFGGAFLMNNATLWDMITSEKQLMNVLNNGLRGKYVYINAHSFERLNYDEILPKCKIILDLYGNGIKCFRNIESAVYGVSAKQDVSIVSHAYPWIDNDNCIMLPINKNNNLKLNQSINLLLSWLTENNQSKLYEIYKRGNKTVVNYEKDVYIKNYIHPKIHKDKVIR